MLFVKLLLSVGSSKGLYICVLEKQLVFKGFFFYYMYIIEMLTVQRRL